MNCPIDSDTIIACCLGELDDLRAGEVRRHAGSCERCGRELRAFASLCGALDALPRVEPDGRLWGAILARVERTRPLLPWRPAVAAAAAAIAVALGYVFTREAPRPPAGVAVEEMGSRFAHRRIDGGDLSASLRTYLGDARAFIDEALACGGDRDRWRALKERAAERDMVYRALWLRERLIAGEGRRGGGEEDFALVDDLLRILRLVSDRPAEALAADREAIGREIEDMDLPRRLERGAGW